MNTREKVLQEALKCVNGEREQQYGSPEDNFQKIAMFWSDYLKMITGQDIILSSGDVSKMMILFKVARATGPNDKLDNYVDIIGYGACGAEIFENTTVQPCEVADKCKECDDLHSRLKPAYVMFDTNVRLSTEDRYKISKTVDDMVAKALEKKRSDKEVEVPPIKFNHKNLNSDVIGYAIIDAEDIRLYSYSYFHRKLCDYVSNKAKEENISLYKVRHVNKELSREISQLLDEAATDCVSEGKYGGLKLVDYYKEIDDLFAKHMNIDRKENKK